MKPLAGMCDVGKKEAQREKVLGNDAYAKRDFKTAMYHYDNAILLDDKELTFHSNRAAVFFEIKDFENCVKCCEKAIEVGQDNKGDPIMISKAMGRMGSAFKKLGKLLEGVTILEKALAEHKTPKNKQALADMVSALKVRDDEVYKDSAIAEMEKNKGNEKFKAGDFTGAEKHYTEAIRRNPTNPLIFSNRAACYCRLLSFDLALKDTDNCIRLDNNFLKGFIRKGKVLQLMGLYSKAKDVFEEALTVDPSSGEALECHRQCSQYLTDSENKEDIRKRALEDPEVKQIMEDPTMQKILKQIQKKPNSVAEHMQSPDIAKKINKLKEVGIVSVVYGLTRPHLDVS